MQKEIILKFPPQVLDQIATMIADQPYKVARPILDAIVTMANDKVLQSYCEPPSEPAPPPIPDPEPEILNGKV
jgi:hypothetical protein